MTADSSSISAFLLLQRERSLEGQAHTLSLFHPWQQQAGLHIGKGGSEAELFCWSPAASCSFSLTTYQESMDVTGNMIMNIIIVLGARARQKKLEDGYPKYK